MSNIDLALPLVSIAIFGGFTLFYIISSVLVKCKWTFCGCGTNYHLRPWSPLLFNTRDLIYDKLIRVPIFFFTLVLFCWSTSLFTLDGEFFNDTADLFRETEVPKYAVNYTFKDNILKPNFIYEKIKTYDAENYSSINLAGFENLLNVLLPLFFAVALQKYMSARNEFLAFCGEVEFMAIYFMTLTKNTDAVYGHLQSQLKRIQTILAMMPTAVYELEKDRDNFNAEKLYFKHENSYDRKEDRWKPCNLLRITVTRLEDNENPQEKRINQSILRDIKKLEETGLGLFECLLHLLLGYIDKIKQSNTAYNTSIERDFIVKWNHINSGWGNIDNSVSYKTPILLDVMFRISLCTYAFFKPRAILYACQDEACDSLVWASFGALFPYLILFIFSDILQDPFQDYKVNPTVTKVAFDTQNNINKLFDLQLGDTHHFSYDDGYDGYKCENGKCEFNEIENQKMDNLKHSVPLGINALMKLLENNRTLFNKCPLYRDNDNLDWNQLLTIMTDYTCWENPLSKNQIPIPQSYLKTEKGVKKFTAESVKNFIKDKLGWRQYDQVMISIYASNSVRKHLQQIVFSGLNYKTVVDRIDLYIRALKPTGKKSDECKRKIIFQNDPNFDDFKTCNNEQDSNKNEVTEKNIDKEYLKGLKNVWHDIKDNIEKLKHPFSSDNRKTNRASFNIYNNTNMQGHLKWI